MSGHSQGGGSVPVFINNNHASSHIVGDGNTVINNNRNINFAFSPGAHSHPSMTIQNALGKHSVPDATFKAQTDKGCMPGTRVKFLNDVFAILKTRSGPRIVWVAGMAGTGKTSISLTLCEQLEAEISVALGGAFFCSRSAGSIERTDVQRIIPTLATALARQFPDYASSLAKLLEVEPEIAHFPVRKQVEVLLKQPLEKLAPLGGQIVFVIDALDECSDQGKLADLLEALADFNGDQPVKFLLTSRPEMHIRQSPINDPVHSSILQLHTIDPALVTEDIRTYITMTLGQHHSTGSWYTPGDVDVLVQLSAGLFIFAATIMRYILDRDTSKGYQERMRKVTSAAKASHAATASVDSIYEFILREASRPDKVDEDELLATRRVLACVLAVRVPVSVESLSELLDVDVEHLRERLNRLHSVVYLPPDNVTVGIRTLHASLGDYLFNRASNELRITHSLGDDNLARGCLNVMEKRLCFNVSQSRSSYEPNALDLPETISHALEYACLQWIHHIANLPQPSTFDEQISEVFRSRFPFWLEVLSMLRLVRRAAAMLVFAASTVQRPDLSRFLRDANVFVASSHDAIERNAPHIYLSALPFADKNSLVYRDLSRRCRGVISVKTFGINQHGGRLVMKLTGHEASVETVAYSPDGHLLASGSRDGSVRIWDMRTGEQMVLPTQMDISTVHSVAFSSNGHCVASGSESGVVQIRDIVAGAGAPRLLIGHSAAVLFVAYSPDSTLIASASADVTIRLWDAMECVTSIVLKGHTKCIRSIAFSPDGQFLASGSDDKTVRLWRVETGESIVPALYMGHMGISSVLFSPDGAKLAAGSYDGSISLWAWRLGENVSTLCSQSDAIRSIRFSPDGQFIVSASANKAVQIWNVQDGHTDVRPVLLGSHLGAVNTVSYSSSGLYVASASDDSTITVWHTGDSDLESESLQAHTSVVSSVAVSPDGTFMVSGSLDGSVRVWSMNTSTERLPPLLGHTGEVHSVAISSDGHLIASGSADRTIRLWDAQKGRSIGMPLSCEHKIEQVLFSPDTELVASGSTDGTVSIWATTTSFPASFSPLCCFIDPNKQDTGADFLHVLAIDFSPDLQYLAVGTSETCVQLWYAANGLPANPPLRAKMNVILDQMSESSLREVIADVSEQDLRSAMSQMTALALRDLLKWAHLLNLLNFDSGCFSCLARSDELIQDNGLSMQVSNSQAFESRPRGILSHVPKSSVGAMLTAVPKQMLSNILNQLSDQELDIAIQQVLEATDNRMGQPNWTKRSGILDALPESKLLAILERSSYSSRGALLASVPKRMLSTIFNELPNQTLFGDIQRVFLAAEDRNGVPDRATRAAVLDALPESKLLALLDSLTDSDSNRGALLACLPKQILSNILNQLLDDKLQITIEQVFDAIVDSRGEPDWTKRAAVLDALPESKLFDVLDMLPDSILYPLLAGMPKQILSVIFNQLPDQELITVVQDVFWQELDWTKRATVLDAVPQSKLLVVFKRLLLHRSGLGALLAIMPKQMLTTIFSQLSDQDLITTVQQVFRETNGSLKQLDWTMCAIVLDAVPQSKRPAVFERLPDDGYRRGTLLGCMPKETLSNILNQLQDQELVTVVVQELRATFQKTGTPYWTMFTAVLDAVPESKLLAVFKSLPDDDSSRGFMLAAVPEHLSKILNQLQDQELVTAVQQVLRATFDGIGRPDWTKFTAALDAVPGSKLLAVFESVSNSDSSCGFTLAAVPEHLSKILNQLQDQELVTTAQQALRETFDGIGRPDWTKFTSVLNAVPGSKLLAVFESVSNSDSSCGDLLVSLPKQMMSTIFNKLPGQELLTAVQQAVGATRHASYISDWGKFTAVLDAVPESRLLAVFEGLPDDQFTRGALLARMPRQMVFDILNQLEDQDLLGAIQQVIVATSDEEKHPDWTRRASVIGTLSESQLLAVYMAPSADFRYRGALLACMPEQMMSNILNPLQAHELFVAFQEVSYATEVPLGKPDWTRRGAVLDAVPQSKLIIVLKSLINDGYRCGTLLASIPMEMLSDILSELPDQSLAMSVLQVLSALGELDSAKRAAVLDAVPQSKLFTGLKSLIDDDFECGRLLDNIPIQMLSDIFNELADQKLATVLQQILNELQETWRQLDWTKRAAVLATLPQSKLLTAFERLPHDDSDRGPLVAIMPKQLLPGIFNRLPDKELVTAVQQVFRETNGRLGQLDWTTRAAVLDAVPHSKLLALFEGFPDEYSSRGSLLVSMTRQMLSSIFNQLPDQKLNPAILLALRATLNTMDQPDWGKFAAVLDAVPESNLHASLDGSPDSYYRYGASVADLIKSELATIFNLLSDTRLEAVVRQLLNAANDKAGQPDWTERAAVLDAVPESKLPAVIESLPESFFYDMLASAPSQMSSTILNDLPIRKLATILERMPTSELFAASDLLPHSSLYELVRQMPVSHFRGTVHHLPNSNIRAILDLIEPESIPPSRLVAVTSIAFSPDSAKIVSGLVNGDICFWDVLLRSRILSIRGHSCSVNAVAWSPDSRTVASGSDDTTFRLWNAENGQNIKTLHGHTKGIRSIAFTPDGRSLVSGSDDGTIRIWDVALITSPDAPDPFSALSRAHRDNGWLLGPSGEPLMWIPQEYQSNLVMGKSCTTLIASHRVVLSADESGLYSGEDWVKCWKDPGESHALNTEGEKCEREDDQQDEALGWFAISMFCLVRFLLIVTAVSE